MEPRTVRLPALSVAEQTPDLSRIASELLLIAADLGHLPEFLKLWQGVCQRDCLAIRLSQKVFVAVKEPTPNSPPAVAAVGASGGICAHLKNPCQRHDTGLRDDP